MVKFIFDTIINIHSSTVKYHRILKKIRIDSVVRKVFVIIGNLILPYLKSSSKLKINENNRLDRRIIVSLTSFPARINKVYIVIESLLNQRIQPNKIILWLSSDQFNGIKELPARLLRYINRGLEIRFVDGDIKSHKKYYYAFKEFPNDYVILVDDDIVYESTLIENLISEMEPGKIKCRYAFEILRNENGNLLPYSEWPFIYNHAIGTNVFFGTGGGSIFIPSSLPIETLDIDKIMDLCPKADDVWLNAMARLGNLTIIKNYDGLLFPVINRDSPTLYQENVGNSMNDLQIHRVHNEYGVL